MITEAQFNSSIAEPKEVISLQELTLDAFDLVVYNDDVNTFEYVISSIVEICDHHPVQAEQCTWLIHYKGKCAVKRGAYDQLKPMCEAFLDRKISAKIEG